MALCLRTARMQCRHNSRPIATFFVFFSVHSPFFFRLWLINRFDGLLLEFRFCCWRVVCARNFMIHWQEMARRCLSFDALSVESISLVAAGGYFEFKLTQELSHGLLENPRNGEIRTRPTTGPTPHSRWNVDSKIDRTAWASRESNNFIRSIRIMRVCCPKRLTSIECTSPSECTQLKMRWLEKCHYEIRINSPNTVFEWIETEWDEVQIDRNNRKVH